MERTKDPAGFHMTEKPSRVFDATVIQEGNECFKEPCCKILPCTPQPPQTVRITYPTTAVLTTEPVVSTRENTAVCFVHILAPTAT
jgi:hypothetical protein